MAQRDTSIHQPAAVTPITISNLGTFGRLPTEVRYQIYDRLRPRAGTSHPTTPDLSQHSGELGILRASKQLSEEIIPRLYKNEVLTLKVGSTLTQWLYIENSLGATWTVANLRDSLAEVFSNFLLGRLEKLQILIHAPDEDEPSQLLCLFKHICDLVDMLRKADSLPPVEIELVNNQEGVWAYESGNPFRTEFEWGRCPDVNFAIALLPFCCILGLKGRLTIPNGMKRGRKFLRIKSKIEDDIDSPHRVDDMWYEENFAENWMHFEGILDDEGGRIPSMMRLERFIFWFAADGSSTYLATWERHFSKCSVDKEMEAQRFIDLLTRHDRLYMMNPLSYNMLSMRHQWGLPLEKRCHCFEPRMAWEEDHSVMYARHLKRYRTGSFHQIDGGSFCKEDVAAKQSVNPSRILWAVQAWIEFYPQGVPSFDWDEEELMALEEQLLEDLGLPTAHILNEHEKHPMLMLELFKKYAKTVNFTNGDMVRKEVEKHLIEGHKLLCTR